MPVDIQDSLCNAPLRFSPPPQPFSFPEWVKRVSPGPGEEERGDRRVCVQGAADH